jgi:hypothetical protein
MPAVGRTLLVVIAITSVASCSDDPVDPTVASDRPVLDLAERGLGTCLEVSEDFPAEVTELPVIGCEQPHSHEIYAAVDYTEKDVYPGLAALESFAQLECLKQFDVFVGISAFDSSLAYTWLVPSLDGWNGSEEDRTVLCVLQDAESAPLEGTMKDKQR